MTMNWVILVWGMVASACLILALIHLLAWSQNRRAKASLAFSVAATSVTACAAVELAMMLATSPEQFNQHLRLASIAIFGMHAGLVAYVCLEFKSATYWLAWSSVAFRFASVILAFTTGGSDVYREITELGTIEVLGQPVTIVTGAVINPWVHVNEISTLLWIGFLVDASVRLWKRGGVENRQRAGVVGGSMVLFLVFAAGLSALQDNQIVQIPYFIALSFLPMILVIAYELGRSLIQVAALADELSESEAVLGLAAESAGLGLWSLNAQGDCIWLTERTRRMFGFARGKTPDFAEIRNSWDPDDRQRLEQLFADSLANEAELRAEYRVIDGEGGTRWISSYGRPYRGENGEPVRLMGASIDISEQKQAAEEILRHNRELARISRVSLVGELSGALVHDLGQPLGAMLANTETARLLLAEAVPDREELREILTDIQDDSVRAGQIIHGMRAFLKQQEIELQPIKVARIFSEVEKLVTPEAILRRTILTFECAPGLPNVNCHRVQMQQVLLNLIFNGLQAMEECGPSERKLHVSAILEGDGEVRISVRDSGRGLPEESLDRVFTPFLTTKDTGLGMGLAICRRIIEAHGGRIWIDNNEGAGATAHIRLPVSAGS